jgi:hypothetical protein
MMTTSRRLALLLASSALLASCGAPDEGADQPTTDPPVAEETTVEPTSPSGTPASGDVVRAIDDLAASLGVDAGEVEVVSVEEVTWRDGSRGCAQPGMAYTQALIDGSRITLRAGGRTYEYHSGGSQPPARCDKPTQ